MIALSTIGFMVLAMAGLSICAFGVLATFADGMASAPSAEGGNNGCLVFIVGLVALCVGVWGLVT